MKKTIYMEMAQKRPYMTPKVEVVELSSNPVLDVTSWPTTGNSDLPEVDDSDDGLYGD